MEAQKMLSEMAAQQQPEPAQPEQLPPQGMMQ